MFSRPPCSCFAVCSGAGADLKLGIYWGPPHSPQWRHRGAHDLSCSPAQPERAWTMTTTQHPASSSISNLLLRHLKS